MVIDCVLFGWELEILEGRLNTLGPYVDKFIICESSHFFQNQPKGFILEKNWDRFSEFHDKIIYIKVNSILSDDPWQNEIQQRRAFEEQLNSMNLDDEDIITVCDVDEWWDTEQFPTNDEVVAFNMPKYNMSLHWYHKNELTGVGGKWRYFKGKNLDHERRQMRYGFKQIVGGIHLTTMGDLDNALKKMSGYAHSEFNDGTLHDKTTSDWENGSFYGEVFTEVEFDNNTPLWIREYKFPSDWYRRRK